MNQQKGKRVSNAKICRLREMVSKTDQQAERIRATGHELILLLDKAESDADLEGNKELVDGIEAMRGALSQAELLHIVIESILARG